MYTQLNAHKYTVYRLTYSQCAILPRAVAATRRRRAPPLTPLHSHLKGRSFFLQARNERN